MSKKRHKLEGARFGKLQVLNFHSGGKSSKWLCVCDCGNTKIVTGTALVKGYTKSCGCIRVARMTKHGKSSTTEYRTWLHMIQRCTNSNNQSWKDYGGRGIRVSERLKDFENFLKDIGERPEGTSLDRINNNGNYEPSNCRWSTRKEQANNTRKRKVILVEEWDWNDWGGVDYV
jgi:hypothetical protein